MTIATPNGSNHVTLKWLSGILITVVLAMVSYFVLQKDRILAAHERAIQGNSDRINVLYERIVRLEIKLDVANEKLDTLLSSRHKD